MDFKLSNVNSFFRSRRLIPEGGDWRMRCRELLQVIWDHSDAAPFRLPVDTLNHPGKNKENHFSFSSSIINQFIQF